MTFDVPHCSSDMVEELHSLKKELYFNKGFLNRINELEIKQIDLKRKVTKDFPNQLDDLAQNLTAQQPLDSTNIDIDLLNTNKTPKRLGNLVENDENQEPQNNEFNKKVKPNTKLDGHTQRRQRADSHDTENINPSTKTKINKNINLLIGPGATDPTNGLKAALKTKRLIIKGLEAQTSPNEVINHLKKFNVYILQCEKNLIRRPWKQNTFLQELRKIPWMTS
ncbi:hypothetical protein CHUAL_009506 [Chamberlinius hualienensis]